MTGVQETWWVLKHFEEAEVTMGWAAWWLLLPSRTFAWSLCQIKKVNKKKPNRFANQQKRISLSTQNELWSHTLPTHLFKNETIMELFSSAIAQPLSPKHITTTNLWQTIQSLSGLMHLDPVAHFQTAAVIPGRFSEGNIGLDMWHSWSRALHSQDRSNNALYQYNKVQQ